MPKDNQDREVIVSKAIGIASEKERAAYIDQACNSNTELKHQVEEQVEAHLHNGSHEKTDAREGRVSNSSFADTSTRAPEQAAANQAEDRENRIARIGPYQVVKQLAEDASCIVFQAEQQEPVRLKAALKVVKHGLDWRRVAARFEMERHVLARMEHPNIAKMIGAGTRQSGQPYFVMELVEGVPLTKYCEEHRLSLQQRLELFASVCQAVLYAHQKGIIHGALKPSNVLVSNQDGKPTPKLLDFGVAKAVQRNPSEDAPSTGSEILGDKPEYLSPEQADLSEPDIDTRSDVYSLGVLLYELVTGTTPLAGERLRDLSITDTLRLIREEKAPPASARLNESKERLECVSAKRQMKPDALVKAVTGDLDCVIQKALQKDRTQRYDTVNELARDIQRYLAKEPVEICPRSTRSQFRTVRRQYPRAAMLTAGIFLLLFLVAVGCVGLAGWRWHQEKQEQKAEQEAVAKSEKAEKEAEKLKGKLKRAESNAKERIRERDEAQKEEKAARRSEHELKAILSFLKHRLLATGRPGDVSLTEAFWAGSQGKDVTVRKDMTLRRAVDEAESHIAESFADRPLAEAAVREMLGLAYLNLGGAKDAVKQYERAYELREAIGGENDPDTAEARNQLAVAFRLAGRDADAARLFHRNPDSSTHAAALAIGGLMLLSQKKPAEAELRLRECLIIRQKIQPDDWTTFGTKSLLGEALLEQKKYADAEPLLLSGYEGMKKRQRHIPTQEKSRLTRGLENLVRLYEGWGKHDKADKWRKELQEANEAK